MKRFILPVAALLVAAIFQSGCEKKEECPGPDTQNIDRVKELFNYFGTGDVASYLNGHTNDCVFDITGNQILNPGKVYQGHEGFMAFLGDLSQKGQPLEINPVDFYASDNVVTVSGNLKFKDFGTEQTCTVNFLQIWKFNSEGKVEYFKEDHDHRVCQ